jgi:hypothetical protein
MKPSLDNAACRKRGQPSLDKMGTELFCKALPTSNERTWALHG